MRIVTAVAFILLAQVAFAQSGKKNVTVSDIYEKNTFQLKDVPGFNAMEDGKRFTALEEKDGKQLIKMYDLETGKETGVVFDNSLTTVEGKPLRVDGYQFSQKEDMLLLFTEGENIYRHSVKARTYIYYIKDKKIGQIDNEKVLHATFSPDGAYVAYVRNNNLHLYNITKSESRRITTDGEWNKVINGNCDWVYEEEFGFTKAFEWSKNGKYLAFYRFDESKVPYFVMPKYTGLYPEQYTYKYPKAGERNSDIQIKILNVETGDLMNADLGPENDQYIPRIKWTTKENKLCIFRMNRLQNKLELLLTNATDGTNTVIYTETSKTYIGIDDDIHFLPDGASMIFTSEKSGYNQLYHYNWKTKVATPLTDADYDIASLVGVDEEKGIVYYTAAYPTPLVRTFWSVSIDTRKHKALSGEKGTHVITPCHGNKYFMDKHSSLNQPPVYKLIDADGRIVRILEDNKGIRQKMQEYNFGKVQFVKILGVTSKLNGWIMTPPDFDSSKKYPVLMYQYSGPGSQEVADRFPLGNYMWHQSLAAKGYIVLCVDGTGTGFRGEKFKKKTYLKLGKLESEDQIAVARKIAEWRFVDRSRIGIWGWSFGGFMSATCAFKGGDLFKAAISVAPVTNWRYYDNIYTERYMRTPKENTAGYDENAPEKMAAGLKGKLLLIHGTADDNVHFQNSVELVDALVNAGKEFDSEYYPDKAHGISGGKTRLHLYNRMTKFILENL